MRKTILKWLILTSLIAYAVIAAIWAHGRRGCMAAVV